MKKENYAQSLDVTPIVRATLANEHWYRNGAPNWLEGRGKPWERPCETAAGACARREKAVQKLGRAAFIVPGAVKLAKRLENCEPHQRCVSGACPECNRALQRSFVVHSQTTLATIKRSEPPLLVSIVPDFGRLPLIDATKARWKSIKLRLRKALREVGITLAMLGVDFSVNTRQTDKFIQGQLWGVICNPPASWKADLKPLINDTGQISRPLRVRVFDGYPAGLAYSIMTRFAAKSWYVDFNHSRDDRGSSSNTRNRFLQGGPDWLQLMLFLDVIGLDSRIVLIGIKRIISKDEVIFQRSKVKGKRESA